MDFFIKTDVAQRAVKLLGVTAKMNTQSFEGQVLIKTLDSKVIFLSNNGTAGISCEVPADITTAGESTVTYSKMKSFIMTFLPWEGEVGARGFNFSTKDTKLNISTTTTQTGGTKTNSSLKLDQIKSSAFISVVTLNKPNLIINSSILKSAIDKSIYAIDSNSSVDYIKGLRMLVENDTIVFTSTNGKVLSDYTVVSKDSGLESGEYFLSYHFLMGLRRILVDDTQLFFEISSKKTILAVDAIIFWSSALSYKEYPNYSGIFKKFDKSIEVNRDILLNGLSSFVDVLNPDDYNRVTINFKNNLLSLKTENSLFEYPEIVEDAEFNFEVDGRDLLNTLYALSDDTIKLKCLDENHGVIFESAGYEDHKSYIVNLRKR